jgi:electron transfer flavoprotein alpha subunit
MANNVWIVLQQRDGKLSRMSFEALAAGQKLAAALGTGAEAVLLGSGVDALASEVAAYELTQVHVADHENLANYTPGAYVGALAGPIREAAPSFVVFPHTYQSVDYVPRLAQTLEAALVPEATAFELDGGGVVFTRPILRGKMVSQVRLKGEGTALVSVQSGAFPADGLVRGQAPVAALALDASAVVPDRKILRVEEVGGSQVDLTKSEIIVAVGRGVGGEDKLGPVQELAEALGADIAASRPVIDNGWLPRDRQIGSSGQTVAPKLYLAAGISGAIQHVVGMKGSRTVVAVNKDPNAPIFNLAQYGIVGDLHEILPALTAAVKEAKDETP